MSRLHSFVITGLTLAALSASAQAEPVFKSRGMAVQGAEGGFGQGFASGARGERGALGRRHGMVADGQGNAAGAGASGFTTQNGGQGLRSRSFQRSDDGSFNANGQGHVSGANGSADRSGSFTRDADGNASGERSTTATNANTGVTLDASTSYTKGSGVSRSATCTDAAGNSVACLNR